jgi:hypothetical protein
MALTAATLASGLPQSSMERLGVSSRCSLDIKTSKSHYCCLSRLHGAARDFIEYLVEIAGMNAYSTELLGGTSLARAKYR